MTFPFIIQNQQQFRELIREVVAEVRPEKDILFFDEARERLGGISDDTLTRRIKDKHVKSYEGKGGKKYIMTKDLNKLR